MKILVTGKGEASGAWKVRGEELGRAIGAEVYPKASDAQVKAADIVITVKHTQPNITAAQGITVLDIVDAYPQPDANQWSREQLIAWANDYSLPYNYTVAATEAMRVDTGADFALRHHYRPDIEENPIRARVQTVGYEGSERYLDGWMEDILRECKRRGWTFLVNPDRLADCDVVLAVRGNQWRGYATDNWKSCVKMSNSIGSITPMIALPERGYIETGAPFVSVEAPSGIDAAFAQIESLATRMRMASALRELKPLYSLEAVANEYLEWLHGIHNERN